METHRHKRHKDELFQYIHNQINGCWGCGPLGDNEGHDHKPYLDRSRPPMQHIIWLCEDGHHHTLDIFANAAWCDRERSVTAPSGLRCRPDITIYDAHRNPNVFIEIRHTHRENNSWKVAKELGALWLQLEAPPPGSLKKELSSSRPWWELTDIPEEARREMDVLTQLGEKLFGPRDGIWAAIDNLLNDDGTLVATTMQHSDPVVKMGEFTTIGGYIWVNQCSLSCTEAQRENALKEKRHRIDFQRRGLLDVQERLGREVFAALFNAGECPAEFSVPIGDKEIHARVALTELTQFDGTHPATIDLQKHVDEAGNEMKQLLAELDALSEQRYPTIGQVESLGIHELS